MLVEQIIALTLIVVTMLALLTVLGAGTTAVVNGRQRTVATSLGRQVLERLQGGAYSSVTMNLASPGLSSDPRVSVAGAVLSFEGEQLLGGSSAPYEARQTVAGTSYAVATFVTAVVPPQGLAYRRVTVFVQWTPSLSGNFHSQRFSTLVYPLDYRSYPAGSGFSEVAGGRVTVSGQLGSDVFANVQMALPTARAATNSSTLRTANGLASGSTAVVDLATGPLVAPGCTVTGSSTYNVAQCPVATVDEAADNDSGTSAPAWTTGTAGSLHTGASITAPGRLLWSLPSGSGTAHAAVDACGGCGYGDGDGLAWAGASAAAGSAYASFTSTTGLTSRLWDLTAGWSATTSVDHDPAGGSRVTANAQLVAPPVKVFSVDDVTPFSAVLVGGASGFTASATAEVGSASVTTPAVTATAVPVQLWQGGGYRTISVTPGVFVDDGESFTAVVGGQTLCITSRVQSAPNTSATSGTNPRIEASAQQPSLLRITVTVATVTGATCPQPGGMTITFDYGQVTAHSAWTVAP